MAPCPPLPLRPGAPAVGPALSALALAPSHASSGSSSLNGAGGVDSVGESMGDGSSCRSETKVCAESRRSSRRPGASILWWRWRASAHAEDREEVVDGRWWAGSEEVR